MSDGCSDHDEIKRKVRKLKKLEIRIRFGNAGYADNRQGQPRLIWDDFFDLNEVRKSGAKYSIGNLASMNKDEYKNVVSEYFFNIYYRFYKENGIVNIHLYDPEVLVHMDLPYDADTSAVKKRFRELAKKYHPDTGGDSARFIDLMEDYRKLIDR